MYVRACTNAYFYTHVGKHVSTRVCAHVRTQFCAWLFIYLSIHMPIHVSKQMTDQVHTSRIAHREACRLLRQLTAQMGLFWSAQNSHDPTRVFELGLVFKGDG